MAGAAEEARPLLRAGDDDVEAALAGGGGGAGGAQAPAGTWGSYGGSSGTGGGRVRMGCRTVHGHRAAGGGRPCSPADGGDGEGAAPPPQKTLIISLSVGLLVAIGAIAVVLAVILGNETTPNPYQELEGYCDHVPPVDSAVYQARREKVGQQLRTRGAVAFVTEPSATMLYLSNVDWKLSERSFLLVVLENGAHFFVVPAFEEYTAREQTGDSPLALWEENVSPFETLLETLQEDYGLSEGQILVEAETRFFIPDGLRAAGVNAERNWSFTVANGAPLMRTVRAIKEKGEIDLLRCANEVTKAAIRLVATNALHEGATEEEIAAALDLALTTGGLTNTWSLVLIDQNAAYPHGTANTIPLKPGHMILIDTGGELHGYQSDISRTFTFPIGQFTAEQHDWWELVKAAQNASLAAIKAGARATDIDAAARDVICAGARPGGGANCPEGDAYATFTHRLGHGIGLQGHEDVYMVQDNTEPLEAGMCFSVEPGLYILNKGGVRIEDIVCAVLENGMLTYELFGPPSPSLADPFRDH